MKKSILRSPKYIKQLLNSREKLSGEELRELKDVLSAIEEAMRDSGFPSPQAITMRFIDGKPLETYTITMDGCQVSISKLGGTAVLDIQNPWDSECRIWSAVPRVMKTLGLDTVYIPLETEAAHAYIARVNNTRTYRIIKNKYNEINHIKVVRDVGMYRKATRGR